MNVLQQVWTGIILVASLAQAGPAGSALMECYASSADRVGVGRCLEQRLREADSELAEAERTIRLRMLDLDAVTGRSLAADAFDRSQQAFVRFLDENCAWQSVRAGAGTGAGDIELDCRIRMTEARTRELRAQIARAPDAPPPRSPAETPKPQL